MKKAKQTFEELTTGHTFGYVRKEAKLPAGTFFWCAFCGGRGRVSHTISRDDGLEFRVGTTCLKRVGLEVPVESDSEPKPVVQSKPEVPIAEVPKEAELSDEALDAIFAEAEEKK